MKIKKTVTLTIMIFFSLIVISFNVNAEESSLQISKTNFDDIYLYENQNYFVRFDSKSSEIGVSISGYIYESSGANNMNEDNQSILKPISDVSVSIKLLNSQSQKVYQVLDPIIINSTVTYAPTFYSWNTESTKNYNVIEKYNYNSPNYEAKLVYDSNMNLVSSEIQIPTWRFTLTDDDGFFSFNSLKTGTYEIHVSKFGFNSEYKEIIVDEDVNIDFSLERLNDVVHINITRYPISESLLTLREIGGKETLKSIDTAIKQGKVGGEIFIEKTLEGNIILQNEYLTIKSLDIVDNKVSMIVSGDESVTGKTIVINVESGYFENTDNIIINYDDESIKIADDINDILNPNDDGSHPEYLILEGSKGVQIMVSIPHFSDHKITIYSASEIVETLGGITAVIIYVIVCMVATIFFVGTIHLRRRI